MTLRPIYRAGRGRNSAVSRRRNPRIKSKKLICQRLTVLSLATCESAAQGIARGGTRRHSAAERMNSRPTKTAAPGPIIGVSLLAARGTSRRSRSSRYFARSSLLSESKKLPAVPARASNKAERHFPLVFLCRSDEFRRRRNSLAPIRGDLSSAFRLIDRAWPSTGKVRRCSRIARFRLNIPVEFLARARFSPERKIARLSRADYGRPIAMAAIEPRKCFQSRQFFKMKKRVRTVPGKKYYLCSPLAAARYINRRDGAGCHSRDLHLGSLGLPTRGIINGSRDVRPNNLRRVTSAEVKRSSSLSLSLFVFPVDAGESSSSIDGSIIGGAGTKRESDLQLESRLEVSVSPTEDGSKKVDSSRRPRKPSRSSFWTC